MERSVEAAVRDAVDVVVGPWREGLRADGASLRQLGHLPAEGDASADHIEPDRDAVDNWHRKREELQGLTTRQMTELLVDRVIEQLGIEVDEEAVSVIASGLLSDLPAIANAPKDLPPMVTVIVVVEALETYGVDRIAAAVTLA